MLEVNKLIRMINTLNLCYLVVSRTVKINGESCMHINYYKYDSHLKAD